ncbi:metal ABC transporter solute-binding protein, Zn/Mn family [Nostoc sp. FACHB-110]|uniref:metal ABC transporter solute-binding protein, Zn/Mn family n=1 Tax=Nostoc sp. FACHB-110 TaxID=2692834 RepID=UPI0037C62D96
MQKQGVPTIFTETTINSKLIQAVAKEAKIKFSDRELFADGLGEKGTEGLGLFSTSYLYVRVR